MGECNHEIHEKLVVGFALGELEMSLLAAFAADDLERFLSVTPGR